MTCEMPDESQIPPFVSQFLKHFVAMAEPWDFWERLEKVVKNQSDLAAQNKTMQKIYKKHRKKIKRATHPRQLEKKTIRVA